MGGAGQVCRIGVGVCRALSVEAKESLTERAILTALRACDERERKRERERGRGVPSDLARLWRREAAGL